MNPHQAKKVDVKSLSPEEQRLFRLYGKLPSKSDHFAKHLKERKYFDSGDYAMSKAGKGDSVDTGSVGSQHPVPENIPHLSSPVTSPNGFGGSIGSVLPHLQHVHQQHGGTIGLSQQAGSPVKESSFLNRETSADDLEGSETAQQKKEADNSGAATSPQATKDAIPIRR
ncbi:camp-regulated phosphoprotein/endosulfine conserved region-domain-containing protein [Bombardia bombarda]|uniref:mRNA stability protein n=1 Tax=Bombardia bombarda TaxID=252184 RepID=A0AA39WGJ2_9PEZI|nr:camp-regulated phosphoprotein/endosulfine conserved region-domain-containing protein [Bombardia bombarda]